MLNQAILSEIIRQLGESMVMYMPETVLLITFIAALMFDLIFKKYRNTAAVVALLGFAATAFFMLTQAHAWNSSVFLKEAAVDPFGQFFKYIILITSAIVIIMSLFSKELNSENRSLGEYYSLICGMTFGMFLLVGATNYIIIYISIELMSISSYVLAGYTKEVKRASEASLKYVIFGAVSSGIMIYGISILYGLTGTMNLFALNHFISFHPVNYYALFAAGIMIIAGIAYKISAVPFHFWTPDVYEGSPVTITALLSVASKAAGFAILIRFLKTGFINITSISPDGAFWNLIDGIDWVFIIAVISVLTMTLGNLVAVWQTNVKRLLAYSSIAHAGYMLLGIVVLNSAGLTAIMVYFFMYMFMNLGAFFFVLLVANKLGSEEIDDYVGLAYRSPVISICMVIFLMSLTGVPPTSGFIGKWYIFMALLHDTHWIWLAVIAVLNSVVSLFYYVKIFRNMFLRGNDTQKPALKFSTASIVVIILLAIPNLYFGIFYSPILEWAESSVKIFLMSH